MKQHITTSELDKLGDTAIDRLNDWLDKHNYFKRKNGICIYPLLSIGQMIEFLDEQTDLNWEIIVHKPLYDVNYPDSRISPDFEDYRELCDALWDVVKEVLLKDTQ